MLATQLRTASRLPSSGFERYGASPDLIARIRSTATEWAERLSQASARMAE